MWTDDPDGEELFRLARRGISDDDPTARRILTSAYELAEDFGLRRFTVDEVARRAGLSRVTVYRTFARKDTLVRAIILLEMHRFMTEADTVIRAEPTGDRKLAAGVRFCIQYLRGHRLLGRLLDVEPDLILPHLTTRGAPVVAAATHWIAQHIRQIKESGEIDVPDGHIAGLAELIVRAVISLVLTPDSTMDITSETGWKVVHDTYLRPFVAMLGPQQGS